MHKFSRYAVAGALIPLLALASLGSSSASQASSSTPQRGGVLHVIAPSPFTDWKGDDGFAISQYEADWMVLPALLAATPSGKIVPDLAQSVVFNASDKTLTVTLRPNLKFSNGQPLTSADVAFSVKQWKAGPVNGNLVSSITSVDTPSPQVAVMHLSTPDAYLQTVLAQENLQVIPNNFAGETAQEFYDVHPIGAGPFMLKSASSNGEGLVLVRNPYYWDASQPYINQVDWTVVPDANQELLQLQSGTANLNAPDNISADQRGE